MLRIPFRRAVARTVGLIEGHKTLFVTVRLCLVVLTFCSKNRSERSGIGQVPAPNIGTRFRIQLGMVWLSNPSRPCRPDHPEPVFLSRAAQSPMLQW